MRVVFVDVDERAKRQERDGRAIARVRRFGAVPDVCGPEVPEAPARGPIRLVDPVSVRVDEAGQLERVSMGYHGYKAAKVCDVFDLMEVRAKRQMFTTAQVETGRRFAALIERHSNGATKCSSLEASGGGTGAGEFMDAFLAEGDEIARMRKAAGQDAKGQEIIALEVRSGGKLRRIMALDLVERVCVGQESLSAVLRGCGLAKSGGRVDALSEALGAALDRMKEVF